MDEWEWQELEQDQEQSVHGVNVTLDWRELAPGYSSCPIPTNETRAGVYIIALRVPTHPVRWTIRKVGKSRILRSRICGTGSRIGPYARGTSIGAAADGKRRTYQSLREQGHTIFYSFVDDRSSAETIQTLVVRTLARGGMAATHHTNISRIHCATGDVTVVNVLPPALLAVTNWRVVQAPADPTVRAYPLTGPEGFNAANRLFLREGDPGWEM